MYNYILTEVTLENVVACVRAYESLEQKHIRRLFDYYNGKQAIQNKVTTEGRPNSKITDNKCRQICDNYLGFINPFGIDTSDKALDFSLSELQDVVKDSIITGVGYLLRYQSEGGLHYKRLAPTRAMVFRDNTIDHNVIGGAFWSYYDTYERGWAQKKVDLYYYDETTCYQYNGLELEAVELVDKWAHHVPGIPIEEYRITSHYDSVIDPALSLQDMLNISLSSYADGRESFSDPFLMITGIGISEESAQGLIDGENKVLNIPLPDGDAKYLIKPDSATDLTTILADIDDRIYKACNCPNLSDPKFAAASGEALKAKLVAFINCCNQYRGSLDESIKDSFETEAYEWPSYWSEFEVEMPGIVTTDNVTTQEEQEV